MKINIKTLRRLIREAIEEGKYDSLNGSWDSDSPTRQRGAKAHGAWPRGTDVNGEINGMARQWEEMNPEFGEENVDFDRDTRSDYFDTTDQNPEEPWMMGVEKPARDPLYDMDDSEEDAKILGGLRQFNEDKKNEWEQETDQILILL